MDGPADARTSTEQRRDDHGQPRSSEADDWRARSANNQRSAVWWMKF
jgi:hypothetical protein